MTTDRELLEAAARAAGLADRLKWWEGQFIWDSQNAYAIQPWNPLTDDGDALRLAVRLNIGVQCHVYAGSGYALAQCGQGENEAHAISIENGADPYAATRRAIVRAAAAMAPKEAR